MTVKKVVKPKAVIMDLMGTAVKTGFIDKILMTHLKEHIKEYLEERWSDKELERDIRSLRKEAEKETTGPKIADVKADKAEQQKTVAEYVIHAVDNKKESKAMSRFRFHMWFHGYDKNQIQTRVYSDVAIQVKKWKDEQVKIYVLSNGWAEATKKFLSKTNHGDLSPMLDGLYDAKSEGPLTDKETYTKLIGKLGLAAGDVLLLTKAADQAKAAKEAGLAILLVLTHRKNIEKLSEEEKKMPRVRSFNEIEFCTPEEVAAAEKASPAAPEAQPAGQPGAAEGTPPPEGAQPEAAPPAEAAAAAPPAEAPQQ